MGEQTAIVRKIHFRLAHRAYACGVGRRWWSQTISSTTSRDLVTCCTCIRILAGREAAPQQSPAEARQ